MTVGRAKWVCLGLVVGVVWSVGGVEVAAKLSKAAQAKQFQRQAIKHLKAKDPQKAIRALKKLKKVTSERWELLYVYGTLLVEYGDTPAERKTGHDLLHEVIKKIDEMGKAEDPYYEPYYNAALDRDYALKEQEDAAYAPAEAAGTAAAYAEYLAAYPQGRHAAEAEEQRKKRAPEEAKRAAEAKRAEEAKRAAEARRAEAERARQALLKEVGEPLRKQMVHVQGGTFRMGCTAEQENHDEIGCPSEEKPVHEVQVSDFEIGQYEVTQAVWEAVMGENPSDFKGCPQCPVESVSWDDVQEFLKELNAMLGEEYRLPTEAEWEYAARG